MHVQKAGFAPEVTALRRCEVQAMECPECGARNADDAGFCTLCHARFTSSEAAGKRPADQVEPAVRERIPSTAGAREPRHASLRRVAVGIAVGTTAGLALTIALQYLPVPFAYLLGAPAGAAITGRLTAEKGGAYGMLASALPAVLVVLDRLSTADVTRAVARRQMAGLARDLPRNLIQPLQSVLAPPPALLVVFLIITAVLVLALGYYGGRYGERLAKGPGFGLS